MARQLINDPSQFADEVVEGVLRAHPIHLKRVGAQRALVRADSPVQGKVGIVTGGGSGHLPTFMGFVGPGLADGAAIGDVFASPSANAILEVIRYVNGGAGVLCLFGNYAGDRMNFRLAAQLAEREGIPVAMVAAADDVASAPKGEETRRRGVAGILFLYKTVGALAEEGAPLSRVRGIAERVVANTRSYGVALSACTIPAVGHPTFEVPEGSMEVGMGLHGEPGVRREGLGTADAVVDELLGGIVDDLGLHGGDRIDVLVNGLGATSSEELYVVYRRVSVTAERMRVGIRRAWVGEYATSLNMAGMSISALRLDSELERLLDAPATSPLLLQH